LALTLVWNSDAYPDISPEWIPKLEELLRIAGEAEGVHEGEVSLSFVDDETIRELNREYRGIDRPTDVLSFPMEEDLEEMPPVGEGPLMWGDIIISVPTARRQSEEYGHSLEREIGFLFVHGFLHLIGRDHDTEENEREMFRIQEIILQKAGLKR